MNATLKLKRAYEAPAKADGRRVLVDRLWPRGITKEALRIDDWAKDLAPSTELRKWFDHDPAKWSGFKQRYAKELDSRAEALDAVVAQWGGKAVTLVFAAKDSEHNQALALKEYLERRLRKAH